MRTSLTLALVMLLPAWAGAQADDWTGKTLILKSGTVPFFTEEPGGVRVSMGNLRHITYKALEEREGKLQVSQGGVDGWVEKSSMLPIDQAEAYFTAAIGDNPHISFLYSRRAAIYAWRGEHDKAIRDQDETVRLAPHEAAYFNNRAISHAARRDYDKAIKDYDEAVRLKPEYSLAIRNRGMCWINQKDYEKALRDFTEAMQLDPRDAAAHSGLGAALAGKKQYAAAVVSFESALHIDPRLSAALNSWAWLLATCPDAAVRDGAKAIEMARRACEQSDWKAPGFIDTLAAAHAEAGQFAEAIRCQEQALQDRAFTNNEEARRRLRLYQEMRPYHQE